MSMRMKTTLSIILIVFVSTAATFFSGLYFTNDSLTKTMEQDMAFAIGIADSLVGAQMKLMKAEAAVVAWRLASAGSDEELGKLIAEEFNRYPDISALSIFDRNGVIISYSAPQHEHDLTMHGTQIEMVYNGSTIISSPFYCSVQGDFVLNVYTPMPSGRILSVTMPGLIFSDMLAKHRLWRTGDIFMLNEEGTFIGAADEEIVLAMQNYIARNEAGQSNQSSQSSQSSNAGNASGKETRRIGEVGNLIQNIMSSDNGVDIYSFEGVERLCAYSLIDDSLLGWRVAVTVPIGESPQADAMSGQIYSAVFFLAAGVIAAFFISRLAARPYKSIEDQNRNLEKMMAEIEERGVQLKAALSDAEEANSAKSNFLAHMSHEIRTPLNAVIGLSELTLGEDELSPESKSNMEKIYGAGATILSIVNDILDISKIESGKFEIYPVQYDTPSFINDAVTLNIVRIGEKPITFRLYVDENLPGSLYGDDLRVKQIFNNLLSNAFKYTNEGTVEWRVSFEHDGDSVWLVSSVRDTGIGIKPEDLQNLFSDYNKADAKTNRRVEGTGLGLAIAKRLAEMMDGTVTVESEYGKGSTFNVRLRQAFVSGAPIGKEVAENLMNLRHTLLKCVRNTRRARVDLSYAHVLVVDDIATNIDVVKGMMKPYGMKIDSAASGYQAIEMIKAESPRYRAVFMDHMMPGMDGIEAAKIIRELGTDYARDIPVIALTANAIVGNEEMFLGQGFQAFISKPIDMARLDAVLRRWVRDKNLEKDLPDADADADADADKDPYLPEGGGSLLRDITIKGVDTVRALERFGGDEAVLVNVLRSYAVNTRTLLSSLREYLAAENLKDYAIAVHGIKGSSYGISAQEMGKAAETLEIAAKAGNYDAVKTGHSVFEKTAEALLDHIDNVLEEIEAAADKPAADRPDPSLLEELRRACKAYDMDMVDEIMERLESYRYESGEKLVAWLREQVAGMTFEAVYGGEWPYE